MVYHPAVTKPRPELLLIAGLLSVSLSACTTQRYGRQTPVSPGEHASLTCEAIAIEIEKSNFFISDIQRQRRDTTGAHVLGFLGDFGIGNVMEGDAAESSGMERLAELRALQAGRSCPAGGVTTAVGIQPTENDPGIRATGGPWAGVGTDSCGETYALKLSISADDVSGELTRGGTGYDVAGEYDSSTGTGIGRMGKAVASQGGPRLIEFNFKVLSADQVEGQFEISAHGGAKCPAKFKLS